MRLCKYVCAAVHDTEINDEENETDDNNIKTNHGSWILGHTYFEVMSRWVARIPGQLVRDLTLELF